MPAGASVLTNGPPHSLTSVSHLRSSKTCPFPLELLDIKSHSVRFTSSPHHYPTTRSCTASPEARPFFATSSDTSQQAAQRGCGDMRNMRFASRSALRSISASRQRRWGVRWRDRERGGGGGVNGDKNCWDFCCFLRKKRNIAMTYNQRSTYFNPFVVKSYVG